MALRPRILSLFAGVAGLDLGLKIAMPGSRVVCYVEREAYAAATLVARMEDSALDQAPVWDDVGTFDGKPWRGAVDLICGGFPCQDISCAGKGEGLEGKRSGLWYEYARIIDEVRPRYVFVENVSALLVRGIDVVLGSLAELGFDAEWGSARASDVGAPHRRERIFILAHRNVRGQQRDRRRSVLDGERTAQRDDSDRCGGAEADMGDTERSRRTATGQRCDIDAGPEPEAGSRERIPLFPPGPSDDWSGILERWPELAPAVAVSGSGYGDGRAEPRDGRAGGTRVSGKELGNTTHRSERPAGDGEAASRTAEGQASQPAFRELADELAPVMAHRVDALRACGNGVVALQCAAAFTELVRRIG